MNKLAQTFIPTIALVAGLAGQRNPNATAPAPQGGQASSLGRVVVFLEQNSEERKALVSRMAGKVETLQRELDGVGAVLTAEGVPERERMDLAARSTDGVLAAIDALLEHETETRRMFGDQSRKLTAEWRRAAAEGTSPGSGEATARAALDQRKRIAAKFALDPDTPEEWRSLFEVAFDLLDANADSSAELSEQQRQIWVETVSLLDELRREVYATYATDLSSYHGLRTMRASKLLQKELLTSGRDLEGLREVSRALRDASKVLVRPDERGAAVTDKIRDLLGRARQTQNGPPQRSRSNEERRRAMEGALRDEPPKAGA